MSAPRGVSAARSSPTESEAIAGRAAAPGRFYRPELDALRFMAFLMVFGSHVIGWRPGLSALESPLAFARAIVAGGGFGVDLFFVLSAYLITELLLREKELTGTIAVRAFYARRVLRIWPLYFGFIGAVFVGQYVVAALHRGPPEVAFPPAALAAFLLLGGNWYSTLGFLHSPVAPLWSVSIEEQFYLLWPAWVRRLGFGGLRWAAVTMVAVANLTRLYLLSKGSPEAAIWCNTLARLDPIAVGIFVAVTLHGREIQIRPGLRAALFLGGFALLGIVFTSCRIQEDSIPVLLGMIGYPGGTLAVTLLFFAFVGSRWAARQPFLYLGQISYGLYVFHVLGLDVGRRLSVIAGHTPGPLLRGVAGLVITVLMAATSYRWFEKPFLRIKDRFTRILSH
jgi:peptidoglycan/LPS O-acetylase OafA/YrhL